MQTRLYKDRNDWVELIDRKPCISISMILQEDVQPLAMLIDHSPQVFPLAPDADEHLIEVPRPPWIALPPAQFGREVRTESIHPCRTGVCGEQHTRRCGLSQACLRGRRRQRHESNHLSPGAGSPSAAVGRCEPWWPPELRRRLIPEAGAVRRRPGVYPRVPPEDLGVGKLPGGGWVPRRSSGAPGARRRGFASAAPAGAEPVSDGDLAPPGSPANIRR